MEQRLQVLSADLQERYAVLSRHLPDEQGLQEDRTDPGSLEDRARRLDERQHLPVLDLQPLQVPAAERRQRHPQVGERDPLPRRPAERRGLLLRHRVQPAQRRSLQRRVHVQARALAKRHRRGQSLREETEDPGQRDDQLPAQEELPCSRPQPHQRPQVQVPARAQVGQPRDCLRKRHCAQKHRVLREARGRRAAAGLPLGRAS